MNPGDLLSPFEPYILSHHHYLRSRIKDKNKKQSHRWEIQQKKFTSLCYQKWMYKKSCYFQVFESAYFTIKAKQIQTP